MDRPMRHPVAVLGTGIIGSAIVRSLIRGSALREHFPRFVEPSGAKRESVARSSSASAAAQTKRVFRTPRREARGINPALISLSGTRATGDTGYPRRPVCTRSESRPRRRSSNI